jgi:hypothetical protein
LRALLTGQGALALVACSLAQAGCFDFALFETSPFDGGDAAVSGDGAALGDGPAMGDGSAMRDGALADLSGADLAGGCGALSFAPPSSLPLAMGSQPKGLLVADLDGQPPLDIAVADYSGRVEVLILGAGAAVKTDTSYLAGYGTTQVATGHFTTNDGGVAAANDLVATNFGDGTITLLLNSGGGKFTPDGPYPVGSPGNPQPVGVATHDDGSGLTDIFVANSGEGTVQQLAGAFPHAQLTNLAAGTSPQQLVFGDFDGDGMIDMAASGGPSYPIGWWQGIFGAFTSIATTSTTAYGIVAGELDGDAASELVVALDDTRGGVDVVRGHAVAPLDGKHYDTSGSGSRSLAIADLDCDGQLDLVVSNPAANSFSVLRGNGGDTFTPFAEIPTAGNGPFGIGVADFDGDGLIDVAVTMANGTVSLHLRR